MLPPHKTSLYFCYNSSKDYVQLDIFVNDNVYILMANATLAHIVFKRR